jgi:hypothetical protein
VFYPHHIHRQKELKPGEWWADAPKREMGPHDGLPDLLRARAQAKGRPQ